MTIERDDLRERRRRGEEELDEDEDELDEDELELTSDSTNITSSPILPSSFPLVPTPSVSASPSPSPAPSSPPSSFPLAPISSVQPSAPQTFRRSRPHRRLFQPNLGPGQHIFQVDLPNPRGSQSPPAAAASASGSSPANDAPSDPDQPPSNPTFTSITTFNPPSPLTACKCPNKSKKPMRHWRTACPYNPNPSTVNCDVCGRRFTRKQNMERHKKDFHSQSGGTKERRRHQVQRLPGIETMISQADGLNDIVAAGGSSAAGGSRDGPARWSPSTTTSTDKG